MQEFVSPSARFPGPQKVQVEDPFVLLTNPFSMSHCVQLVEAAPEIIPTGQRVQLAALASEKRPASHKEQDSAPSVEYVPPLQSWQVDAPRPAYVPASHDEPQSDEPAELNLPTGQFSQASWLGVVFFPLSHWKHLSDPLTLM